MYLNTPYVLSKPQLPRSRKNNFKIFLTEKKINTKKTEGKMSSWKCAAKTNLEIEPTLPVPLVSQQLPRVQLEAMGQVSFRLVLSFFLLFFLRLVLLTVDVSVCFPVEPIRKRPRRSAPNTSSAEFRAFRRRRTTVVAEAPSSTATITSETAADAGGAQAQRTDADSTAFSARARGQGRRRTAPLEEGGAQSDGLRRPFPLYVVLQ